MEKQKEVQDKIRFGLMQPPEPRMRLNNIMAVLGDEAVSDPSTAEAKARKQIKERKTRHEAHNDARRLSTEEKREKLRRKLQEDTSFQIHVALFRAGDFSDSQRRFKVDVTAQQYNLTGVTIIIPSCNLTVVEGGPRGIKKFKRLMLSRIKWTASELEKGDESSDEEETEKKGGHDSDDEDAGASGVGGSTKTEKDKESSSNLQSQASKTTKCVLVWEGTLARRSFKTFRFESLRTETLARKYLSDKGVAHYWDMCKNYVETT